MKKFLKLFNVKNWFETFVAKIILNKGVKHAVTVAVGLIMGAKAQQLAAQYGISVDAAKLQAELTVLFGGAAGALINWAQSIIDSDGDGKIG